MSPRSLLSSFSATILLVFTFASILYSQTPSYLDSLNGKFALQFQIDDNFNLSSFQGTTLSAKYHFSCRSALRLGLSLELGDSQNDTKVSYFDTTLVRSSSDDSNRFGFTIKSQYIHYMRGTKDISFFGGLGPSFNYFKLTRNRDLVEDGTNRFSESDGTGFTIGVDIIAGVEWMFADKMALSAEYGLFFSYTSSENKNKDESLEANSEYESFNLSGNHINFGLSVYF